MRVSIFCISLILIGFISPANAARVEAGYPACVDTKSMDEFTTAAVRGDQKGMDYLIGKRCIYTAAIQNNEITVLKSRFFKGLSEIRVYLDDGALELVVPSEAIK